MLNVFVQKKIILRIFYISITKGILSTSKIIVRNKSEKHQDQPVMEKTEKSMEFFFNKRFTVKTRKTKM